MSTPSVIARAPSTGNPDEAISPLAGKPAPKEMLVDVAKW